MSKLAYSIEETIGLSGMGRTKIYEHINKGQLPARKNGRRTLILKEDLEMFLKNLPKY